jgi:hypothetical protein
MSEVIVRNFRNVRALGLMLHRVWYTRGKEGVGLLYLCPQINTEPMRYAVTLLRCGSRGDEAARRAATSQGAGPRCAAKDQRDGGSGNLVAIYRGEADRALRGGPAGSARSGPR